MGSPEGRLERTDNSLINQKNRVGFLVRILAVDESLDFAKRLTMVSIVLAVAGSYFQYSSWREEQGLALYKEDLNRATEAFSEVSAAIATSMTYQQILFFTYRDAMELEEESEYYKYLYEYSREIYGKYVQSRLSFREKVDVLARRAEIYIDWPILLHSPSELLHRRDLINKSNLDMARFSCALTEGDLALIKRGGLFRYGDVEVDYSRTQHNIVALYHCFNIIHFNMLPIRIWAAGKASRRDMKANSASELTEESANSIRSSLDSQIDRFEAFISLAMKRIEQIRMRNRSGGFVCQKSGLLCDGDGSTRRF